MPVATDNLLSVTRRWRDLIIGSPEIEAFCTSVWGRSLKVFVGLNGKKPPVESDCPYVVLVPREMTFLEDDYPNSMTIGLGWVVASDVETTNASGGADLGALALSDDLGRLLLDAVLEDRKVTPVEARYAIGTDMPELWPQFSSSVDLTVKFK